MFIWVCCSLAIWIIRLCLKQVAKSANRALGPVIAKYKEFGGLPFNTFTQLFYSVVRSAISYGGAVWRDRQFSCITAVQNRAKRLYLGVGRYTPNAAVNGDIGRLRPFTKQRKTVVNHWCCKHLTCMYIFIYLVESEHVSAVVNTLHVCMFSYI